MAADTCEEGPRGGVEEEYRVEEGEHYCPDRGEEQEAGAVAYAQGQIIVVRVVT